MSALDRIRKYPRLRLTPQEFYDLGEYSASVPTGTTPGKRWKCHLGAFDMRRNAPPPVWLIGEYEAIPGDDKNIKINWYRPVIVVKAKARPGEIEPAPIPSRSKLDAFA